MQIDLKTIAITPLRQTFDHLAARFGDKPASRYQEGTYDLQQTYLFHYRPTWDPDREIFDERRTALKMRDWYDLKDPRQLYYGTYTIARSKQQETADGAFEFAVDGGLIDQLPPAVRALVLEVLLPTRHVEWGANMNNTFISAYGYGTAIEAACMYAAMDRLGIAQQTTRIGLAVGGEEALDAAKEAWLHGARWQPLRKVVEDTLVVKDWFELFVAQNLVLDALVYELLYNHVDRLASSGGSALFGLVTKFMKDWQAETARWVDAVVKAAADESPENRALIKGWTHRYAELAVPAVEALAGPTFGPRTAAVVQAIHGVLTDRLQKLGL
jgi:phenol/toluene 2-monooxygenase (NADH) P1/A1